MTFTWERDKQLLSFGTSTIACVCDVRNELNKRRSQTEKCVFTENRDGSQGVPYMPRLFPKGLWLITGIFLKDHPYEFPFFIATDAHQLVDVWNMSSGSYAGKLDQQVEDYGYGLHNSTSRTTLGCGRIMESKEPNDHANIFKLKAVIDDIWTYRDVAWLEVV